MAVATALLDRPADQPGRPPRVLLVDPDDTARRAVARALRTAGLDVTAVPADDQALAVLVSVQPDVLVTGVGLVRTLRVREVDVPVLAVGPQDDRVAAFQAGADDFLATPFGPGELISRVVGLAHSRV
jgi:DNA-binding response OmpR family regulator